ncbi:MAG: acyl-CoA thioesterase [Gammaproteobacteria bacterium]|nr:acyl-CoA thioesterase [Gammaproteobacteria bacterium]MCP5458386.1 acyl-CoA thioesterase [Gammaproteobacteria bacterium]
MKNGPHVFVCDKLIRFHHCDPAGIVFYPQYFVLFNELVEDWFNQGLKTDFAAFHTVERMGTPMRKIECDFLLPSEVGETLRMRLAVRQIGNSSLHLDVSANHPDDFPRVQAKLLIVLISLDTQRPIPFPEELRTRMEKYMA